MINSKRDGCCSAYAFSLTPPPSPRTPHHPHASPPGYFAESDIGPCTPCDIESYSDEYNAAACTPCPDNSVASVAASSLLFCTCKPGFFSTEGPGTECLACPEGTTCEGGVSQPFVSPGWFQPDPSAAVFVYCSKNPDACLGTCCC